MHRHRHWQIPLLAVLGLLQFAQAQVAGTWTQLPLSPATPPAMAHAMLIYDPVRDRMVLFDGRLWEFDGSSWGPVFSNSNNLWPLWWDPQRGKVVGFDLTYSGVIPIGAHLREWTGSTWTLLGAVATPHQRMDEGSFAYDPSRSSAVWYLGNNNRSDTWVWNNSVWTQRSAGGPLPRTGESMVFDAGRQEVVLFGGAGRNDTWTWDGTAWREHFGIAAPPDRHSACMAYDLHRGRVILFGGSQGGGSIYHLATLHDTWEWDGSSWTPSLVANPPPDLAACAFAYDSLRQRCMMFGGRNAQGNATNQAWIYEGVSGQQAVFAPYGQGCPGPAGTPAIGNAGGSLPRLGQTCSVTLSNLPTTPFNVPFGVAGFDNQSWNGQPLPLPLDPLGMPGCSAWVRPDLGVTLVNSGGTATWNIVVPYSLGLLGTEIFLQGGVTAPGWNPAGVVGSNAARLVVGSY